MRPDGSVFVGLPYSITTRASRNVRSGQTIDTSALVAWLAR